MFLILSKILPLLIYPLGLAALLILAALVVYRRRRWQTTLLVTAFLLLWLGGNRFVAMGLAQSLERLYAPLTEIPKADVIVILGGGTRIAGYPRPLAEVNEAGDRILYAAWLYQQQAAAHLLVSGGSMFSTSGSSSEAKAMGELLQLVGVPVEAIWLEDSSRNTFENASETRNLLESRGIKRIILVTSAMHMPRSVPIFQKQGFEVIAAPTDYAVIDEDWKIYTQPDVGLQIFNLLPNATDLDLTTRAIKEYIGLIVYRLQGWL